MRRRTAGAWALAVLILCAPAWAEPGFGVADDGGKYSDDGGAAFFSRLLGLGMTENRITVLWHADRPATIVERGFLDRSLPQAAVRGVRVVFHDHPARATGIASRPGATEQFARFVGLLARRYPLVRDYIVGNEPNQPRFWRPQFDREGRGVSAAAYAALLARSYDTLKAVDPTINVIGLGLSSRGNDSPWARSNVSTSPVRFLRDLGRAYRSSGRSVPLMDELAFHPYPSSDGDSYQRGHPWPRAGVPNLARVKQAVWDAFGGTAQPTFEEGLRLRVDEIGWQVGVVPTAQAAYHGRESVAVTSEADQARNYAGLIERLGCDPSVSGVYLLGLTDDPDLERFQSGLLRADGSARPAYAAVRKAIRAVRSACPRPISWRHTERVLGARASFGRLRVAKPMAQTYWSFHLTAAEDASYRAAVVRVPLRHPLSLARPAAKPAVLVARGSLKARWRPLVRFPARRLAPGRYVYAVELRAAMNPARTRVFVSRPFSVGTP